MLSGIAFALAERGHRVTVIASRLGYETATAAWPPRETIAGVEVRRVATSSFGRSRLVGRALDYVSFYIASAWALLRCLRRGDIVVVKTDPPMLAVVVWPIAALRGARLVNWLQDVFPEVALALGVGSRGPAHAVLGLLGRIRDATLSRARVNVVLGERMADHVAARGAPRGSIRIVANWADGKQIVPVPRARNELRRAWGLGDDFVVGYSGNLGRAHDHATLLEAMRRIERAAPSAEGARRVRWLLIGGGAQFEALTQAAAVHSITSIVVKPYQPAELLSQSLSIADVHLVTLRPELEGLIVPSKIYGIMAAGRAAIFIGDGDGEVARLLRRTGAGTSVAQGDGAALAEAVARLAGNAAETEAQGRRARAAFEDEFDRVHAVGAWERVIAEASGDADAPRARTEQPD